MLRRCSVLQARRKHGQKAWSPNATSSGAAPATGLTMQEALQVAYRPMPPAQTVEYEEDFGRNMMIHREFVSKKHRQQMSFDQSPLAFSDVELRRGQQRLADAMNRERRGVLVGSSGTENDRVHLNTDLGGDDQAGSVESARFLFNERRMQYCDNFQECMRKLSKEAHGAAEPAREDAEDSQVLFSLMEACAIIYGCDTAAAQEEYFRLFCRLDLDSLEEDGEALAARREEAVAVNEQLEGLAAAAGGGVGGGDSLVGTATSAGRGQAQVQQIIDAMPGLFDVDGDDAGSAASPEPDDTANTEAPPEALTVPEGFAPLYNAYLAHTRGESPLPSHDLAPLVASSDLADRRQWRDIMERLIRQDYSNVTAADLKHAAKLNEQLHSVKFMDLKVGDTVKEIMALLQRETGDGSSVDRDTPLEVSPSHPERRV